MIRRVTGTGTAATMMLALLVLACVFVAVAGPRENLAAQTQALRKALAASSPQAASVVATADWNQFTSNLPILYPSPPNAFVTSTQISEATSQIRGDLTSDGVPLAPAATDWFGLTSVTQPVMSGAAEDRAHLGGLPANLEVAYRDPFTRYTALIAGRYPGGGSGRTLQVAVTRQTAARLGLHVGSKLVIGGAVAPITLDVTGIIQPRSPGSPFWTSHPATAVPVLVYRSIEPVYWVVGVFVGAGEVGQLQQVLSRAGLTLEWHFPVALGGISGDQVQRLQAELSHATAQAPPLAGDLAPTSGTLTITTGLLTPLAAFIATQSAVSGLTWLLFASLTVLAAMVLLLAAYMLAVRREAEFTMVRARGASVRQIAGLALRGCAIVCLPAAVAGAVLAVALVPHSSPPAAWWLGGITVFIAIVGPAVIAAWRHRFRRRPARPRRVPRRRLVTEAALCAAAVAGLIVLRSQQPTRGIDLYTSAVPVLVAIPAVVISARLLPLVLRALLRTFGGRASATGFVGLARAARTSLTPTLPAFALVLALTLAAFAGMVMNAITRGEVAASWQAVGGDARIQTEGAATVTPAARQAIGAVPGVRQTATAWLSTWALPGGRPVDGIAVDPASYAALVATTQTWPQVPAAKLAFRAGQPVPVLASQSVAASLAGAAIVTTTAGLPPLRVRVAGILSGTPAAPGDQDFFIVPITAIRSETAPPPNVLLVTGSGISAGALAATAQRILPGSLTTTRSAALDALSGAPLQHGIYLIFALAIAVAAGLGLVVMLLELALGTTDRELILARLATMGLAGRQRIWLTLLEIGPPLLAAAIAATACALALPRLLGPALDLSLFTGSGVPVRILPDFTSVVLPLAVLALLAVVALAIETRAQQRRGIAAQLRADS
jgi:putative ABC transport system permease protein